MTKIIRLTCAVIFALMTVDTDAHAQAKFTANYDESKVPDYTLPDPLLTADGKLVTTVKVWENERRPEILRLFEMEVYGRVPEQKLKTRFKVVSEDKRALNGNATRKQVSVYFSGNGLTQRMDLLLYLPNDARPAPLFLGMNFFGNHSIHNDPQITLSTNWMRASPEMAIVNNRATEQSRGKHSSRWPVEKILQRGYGVATVYYGDIVPDDAINGLPQGIHRLFRKSVASAPVEDKWGAISGWAWGLSRAVDYLQKDNDIDAKRIAVIGHSRLGKAALWAGATDKRFALVISNNSGCGGAALSRRKYGETVGRINESFPHWFCGNFKKYNYKEETLPIDQHQLIALMAPRPVYVASAEEDRWADPLGEFLAAKHAGSVYKLYGKEGLNRADLPAVNQTIGNFIGYHIRTGKHDVTEFDWDQYLSFADRHLKQPKQNGF